MGFLGRASEFFAAPGASVGSFLGNALHEASNFACQLHYNTPGVIFDVSPFNRALWKELCADRPSGLPVTTVPFRGGQCPVEYFFQVDSGFANSPPFTITVGPYGGADVELVGSITNISYAGYSPQTGRRQFTFVNSAGQTAVGYSVFANDDGVVPKPLPYPVRRDGLADNCGDPPPPGSDPVILPPEQRTTNINVTNVDGSLTNVSVVVDFPSALVDFDANVLLRVTIDSRKFHLNVDGWYTGFPSPSVELPSLPDIERMLSDNVLQLEGTLNQYFAPVNPSIDNTLVLVSPSGGKPSDEQQNVPGAAWLIIDLTKLPDKAQYGGDSPTVYFAGWMEFLKEGRAFPRQQINFERSIFRFPDGADGYAYTFTNGAQGNVSVYVEEAT